MQTIKNKLSGTTVCRMKQLRINRQGSETYIDSPYLGPKKPAGDDDGKLTSMVM